ncbi:MAG: sigma 54-interacting transcriptional regulator [Syntrophales bacterium]|nr:sigma 54-interacting transcriptional regulator [Syntrophales bacterium]
MDVSLKYQVKDFEFKLASPYYEERYKKTLIEWERFIQGADDIDPSIVPEEVAAAWRRCREMKLDPLSPPRLKILSESEFSAIKKENEKFISVSRPFLENLYLFVKGSRYVVALFDRNGVILEVLQDEEAIEENRKLFWYPGVKWTEDTAGNNAAHTVLKVKKPIRIFSTQHYLRFFHHITASSAPIFAPDGELTGGIALTAFYYSANPHTLGMAVAAAKAIENELKAAKVFGEYESALRAKEVAYSLQKAVISSIPEALIAIDSQGFISLINEKAQKKFFPMRKNIEGCNIKDILRNENAHLLNIVEKHNHLADIEVRINTPQGEGDFSLTIRPVLSSDGQMIGKVLLLAEIKRIKNLVTKMIGAKAKFHFEDIQGINQRFLQTLEQARLVSQNSANVLLLGESGTGKDIFAQAIHNASDRKNGPYVAINCAAIPRDLISSELFGYSEGAFTGSRRGGSQGKFELADGGTIFLDEIAEIPLELQAVLLRVIEDKSVIRIGGTRVRPVDVRIIAATNKNLMEEVKRGNFRKDLYYRLNVFTIHLLPLSERMDDIPVLTNYFISKYNKALGKDIKGVDREVWEAFMSYSWPGNVRELQNVIERMMHYASGKYLTSELLPSEIVDQKRKVLMDLTPPLAREEWEKEEITRLLNMHYKKKQIAERLHISRTTLFRRMKKYNLPLVK